MDLKKLIEVLPYERITQDEAVRLLFEAGVKVTQHDDTAAVGVLVGMAHYGLIRRPGGPHKPDVERIKDTPVAAAGPQPWPTAVFHPIDTSPDPYLVRALAREMSK